MLVRGAGVGLRLTMPQSIEGHAFVATYDEAVPRPMGGQRLHPADSIHAHRPGGKPCGYAPWQEIRSERVVADFLPDLETGKFQGALEEFASVWHPRKYKSFDSALEALQNEYRQWLTEMPAVPEEFSKAAELAAYVNWESVVAPEGHLTRPAMLMSKNWMTRLWSWDDCFNAMALISGNPELAWDQVKILFR